MILLKISNSSELVASKLGRFAESLTPNSLDESTVEYLVAKEMINALQEKGVKGEISCVKGIDNVDEYITITNEFKIKKYDKF